MRDVLVKNQDYFNSFIKLKDELILASFHRIENGEVANENIPKAYHLNFVKKLEILVAMYSMGEPINIIKSKYIITLNYMVKGWDDSVVKFKKGRPSVFYNKYWLNDYSYMVWMLSFAILLRVSSKEIKILESLIKKGNIDDELILFLLSSLTQKKVDLNLTKVTYNPFKSLLKNDYKKTDSLSLKKYLGRWYINTRLLTWHSYKYSIESKFFYYGYWSFETAALVAILNLDDNDFKDHQYYPKDLVEYFRKNKCRSAKSPDFEEH